MTRRAARAAPLWLALSAQATPHAATRVCFLRRTPCAGRPCTATTASVLNLTPAGKTTAAQSLPTLVSSSAARPRTAGVMMPTTSLKTLRCLPVLPAGTGLTRAAALRASVSMTPWTLHIGTWVRGRLVLRPAATQTPFHARALCIATTTTLGLLMTRIAKLRNLPPSSTAMCLCATAGASRRSQRAFRTRLVLSAEMAHRQTRWNAWTVTASPLRIVCVKAS
eukprot:Rmarinus@m.20066